MNKISQILFATTLLLAINACKTLSPVNGIDEMVTLDTIEIDVNSPLNLYRSSEKRVNDLTLLRFLALQKSKNYDLQHLVTLGICGNYMLFGFLSLFF